MTETLIMRHRLMAQLYRHYYEVVGMLPANAEIQMFATLAKARKVLAASGITDEETIVKGFLEIANKFRREGLVDIPAIEVEGGARSVSGELLKCLDGFVDIPALETTPTPLVKCIGMNRAGLLDFSVPIVMEGVTSIASIYATDANHGGGLTYNITSDDYEFVNGTYRIGG